MWLGGEAVAPEVSEASVKKDAAEVAALCREGNAQVGRGELAAAIASYERGLELADRFADLQPAVLRLRAGAVIWAGLSTDLRTTQLAMLTSLALCRLRGHPADAAAALAAAERALGLDPQSAKAAFCQGQSLAHLGRHGEAEAALARAVELDPTSATFLRELERARQWGTKAAVAKGGEQASAPAPQPSAGSRAAAARPGAEPGASVGAGGPGQALGFPSPLADLGLEAIEEMAARVASTLEERGVKAFTGELLRALQYATEQRYGPGAGSRIARLTACAGMIANRQTWKENKKGKGERWMNCCVEGLLPVQPFHDVAEYPWLQTLASHKDTILDELKEQAGSGPWRCTGDYSPLCAEWRSITVMEHGCWLADTGFPRTRHIFKSLSGVRIMEVFMARMTPHTRLAKHSDSTNFLLTAHVGLELDEERNFLTVGESTSRWREGGALVFDHSYVHSAANESERDRYVLGCRFWHPGCSDEEAYALSFMMLLLECLRRQGRVEAAHEAARSIAQRQLNKVSEEEEDDDSLQMRQQVYMAGSAVGLWGQMR